MNLKHLTVRGLDVACQAVDEVAYRPAVVKLTLRLPRWWRCDLSRLSMWLDDRWRLGYWNAMAPDTICDACQRRAAWLVVGGYDPEYDEEPLEPDDYMGHHPVYLCGWCRLESDDEITDEKTMVTALQRARSRSIAWRWRLPV